MSSTVVFLGAGATKACNGPLTDEILPGIYKRAKVSGTIWASQLVKFLEQEFHLDAGSPKAQYPSLPLLLSLLDTALDRRQAFTPDWSLSDVAELRRSIEFGIYDLLEELLQKGPTNNHWALLNRLYPALPEAPVVISMNYDLIADAAMMFLSEYRTAAGDVIVGRFPDYRCDVSTSSYRDNPQRFGTLLKLHGSLNWLCCSTCARLELGRSSGRLYIKILDSMIGPDLQRAFTLDGDPCPVCNTILRPLMVAPSHLKIYRNPHLAQVWYEAERALRAATRVVFIGYSLPDDDVEVIYLLKRTLSRAAPPQITVVDYDAVDPNRPLGDHAAGRRFRSLFGNGIDWHACGLDAWLDKLTRQRD